MDKRTTTSPRATRRLVLSGEHVTLYEALEERITSLEGQLSDLADLFRSNEEKLELILGRLGPAHSS